MKLHLLSIPALLSFSLVKPGFAQEASVDPEVRSQIEAVAAQGVDAYNKHDAAAFAAGFTVNAIRIKGWIIARVWAVKPLSKTWRAGSARPTQL